MPRKKKEINKLQEQYSQELEINPELSLLVDPTNKYKFTEEQKKFIEYYIQVKNIEHAALMSNIDPTEATKFMLSYNAQSEIRRINLAICHHQFNSKMASLEQIGGYLTSLITGEFSPLNEQLSTRDKVEVSKILIEINKLQNGALDNPAIILTKNIDVELKNLSVSTIKSMLLESEKKEVNNVSELTLTPEEVANIKSQSKEYEELLNLVNNKKGGKNE